MQFMWNVSYIECGVVAYWLVGVLVAKVKEKVYQERVGIGNPFEGYKWHKVSQQECDTFLSSA